MSNVFTTGDKSEVFKYLKQVTSCMMLPYLIMVWSKAVPRLYQFSVKISTGWQRSESYRDSINIIVDKVLLSMPCISIIDDKTLE